MIQTIKNMLRRRRFAPMPTIPSDCILVLAITSQGRISGWQTPDSAREGGMRYQVGTTFLCLTQNDVDQFIPPHSPEVDEDTREQREYADAKQERLAIANA